MVQNALVCALICRQIFACVYDAKIREEYTKKREAVVFRERLLGIVDETAVDIANEFRSAHKTELYELELTRLLKYEVEIFYNVALLVMERRKIFALSLISDNHTEQEIIKNRLYKKIGQALAIMLFLVQPSKQFFKPFSVELYSKHTSEAYKLLKECSEKYVYFSSCDYRKQYDLDNFCVEWNALVKACNQTTCTNKTRIEIEEFQLKVDEFIRTSGALYVKPKLSSAFFGRYESNDVFDYGNDLESNGN